MVMNQEIRTLAFERAPGNKIRKAALASGMKSLLADGRLKVLHGITTAEEIVKVAQVEGITRVVLLWLRFKSIDCWIPWCERAPATCTLRWASRLPCACMGGCVNCRPRFSTLRIPRR